MAIDTTQATTATPPMAQTTTAVKPTPDVAKPADPKHANDSEGQSLEVGSIVHLRARVTAVDPVAHTVTLEIRDPKKLEKTWNISAITSGLVKSLGFNPRIGAAPQLRTSVTEVPAKDGGVRPVADDMIGKDNTSTAGLPTATAEHAEQLAPVDAK